MSSVANEFVRDVIFERNYVHGTTGTLVMNEAADRVTIRNNILYSSTSYPYASGEIFVFNKNTTMPTPPSNTAIYNNTIYRTSSVPFNAIGIAKDSAVSLNPTATVVKNNLVYAPAASNNNINYTGVPIFIGSYSGASWISSNNSSDIQLKNTPPGFNITPTSLTDWKPSVDSYAIGAGVAIPVWDDFFLNMRVGANTIGAAI